MTIVVAATTPQSIWLLADRRLSFKRGKPFDEARKVFQLQARDGIALIGYAGQGSVDGSNGEISDWMSRVLRGRQNLSIEECLVVLQEASMEKLPKHLAALRPNKPVEMHFALVAAFIDGFPRLYSLNLAIHRTRNLRKAAMVRHINSGEKRNKQRSPYFLVAGSGSTHFKNAMETQSLRKILKAYDRGRVTENAVAHSLARINLEIHENMKACDKNPNVGPNSVVLWSRLSGTSGGAFFRGAVREHKKLEGYLASINNGMDVKSLVQALQRCSEKAITDWENGSPWNIDDESLLNELNRDPDSPDDTL